MVAKTVSELNAKTIPAFLRFASVRIENSQSEIARLAVQRAQQNPIGPHAIVAVTDSANNIPTQFMLDLCGADHNVVVAQRMVF